ncbi:hypothetical protein Moror_6686 [Moniliophthora roreri MCA 2997]|uniref:Uncharacterized protein n=1 Tax=Moniliophthora roreri (strain MCA 2997) TaxID=1381753 RepID=V2XV63_MONRO|nr:hypothetical protein Moror_6686 [Moniliophthora roreri MCA 2997]
MMPRLTEVDPNVPRPKGTKGTSGSSNSSAPSSNAPHIFSPTGSYHGSGRTDTPATTYSYASLKYDGSPGGAYSTIGSQEFPAPSYYSQSVYSPSLHPQTPNNSPFYSSTSSPFDGSTHTFQSPHATAHSSSRHTSLLSPASQHSHHTATLSPFVSPQASSFTTIYAGAGAGAPPNTPAHPSNPSGFNSSNPPYNGPNTPSSPRDIILNPLIHPNTLGVLFDVTRPLTSITFTSANANVHDQATSPGIKSGYLVLEFSFEVSRYFKGR